MKKINKKFYVVVLMVICVAMLCSCASNNDSGLNNGSIEIETTNKTNKVLSFFKNAKSLETVLDEAGEVDLYLTPDYSSLTKKTDKSDESASAVDYYYSGSELVYADYSPQGKNAFDYYFKSKSGNSLKASYTDGDKVIVEAKDYTVEYTSLNKKADYGADKISVVITVSAKNDFANTLNYKFENEKVYVALAQYYDTDGYHKYTSSLKKDGTLSEENALLFKKEESIKGFSKLKAFCQDSRIDELNLLIGEGSYSYVERDGKKEWYYSGSAYAVFSDRYDAYEFADENSLEVKQDENDEETWIVEIKDKSFEISDSFENFWSFAAKEVSEPYYASISIDRYGRIKALEKSDMLI